MPSFQFHNSEHGSVGCTIGVAPHIFVGAFAEDAAGALHRASELASQMQALVAKHPELQTALAIVPGGTLAFKAIAAASKALQYGHSIEHVISNYGPKVANVVSKILDIF